MRRRISARVMNIFTEKNFNFEWLFLPNFLHCEHQRRFPTFLISTFVLPKLLTPRLTQYQHLTFVNFSGRFFCAQIRHAYWYRFIYSGVLIVIRALNRYEWYEFDSRQNLATQQKY